MIKEALEFLVGLPKPEQYKILDVNGVETVYSSKTLHQVMAAPPDPKSLIQVGTLAGFADLVRAKLEDQNFPMDYLIHVENETTVTLKSRLCDVHGRRQIMVRAIPIPFEGFKFGQWLPQEEFSIQLAARFADGGDKDYALKMAASLTNENTRKDEDDGFTQVVTVKTGLAKKETQTLKPRVSLAPFRTFQEIDQPLSDFIYRAKTDGEGTPHLCLFEADGGKWKLQAINTLREHIGSFDLGIPIIA